jgi:hypothetical protein
VINQSTACLTLSVCDKWNIFWQTTGGWVEHLFLCRVLENVASKSERATPLYTLTSNYPNFQTTLSVPIHKSHRKLLHNKIKIITNPLRCNFVHNTFVLTARQADVITDFLIYCFSHFLLRANDVGGGWEANATTVWRRNLVNNKQFTPPDAAHRTRWLPSRLVVVEKRLERLAQL